MLLRVVILNANLDRNLEIEEVNVIIVKEKDIGK